MLQRFLELLILTFAVLHRVAGQGQLDGKTCYRADDNFPGICTGLTSCVEVLKGLSRGVAPSLCGYNGFKPIVCCPESRSVLQIQSKRISAQSEFNILEIFDFNDLLLECEEYSELTKDRFYINEGLSSVVKSGCASSYPLFDQPMTTNNGEFPHMAAIGWTSKGFIRFKCAGSLISDRFVLTAAHVFYVNDDLPSFVRLGDQNLRNRLDGMNEVDIGISKIIVHENLNLKTYENDIALLKLESSVTFTDFIRPACLWQSWHTRILEPTVVSTGWGYLNYLGQTMDELTKVELQIVDDDSCIEILKSWNSKPLGLEGSQICAGVISDKTHACTFIDSGGPIQITEPSGSCIHHIVGVSSFSGPTCDVKIFPDVFTKVFSYLDWIEEKVWG